jgi:hypothetical protein
MAANNATLQILRSYANTTPNNLLDGQLAYSFVSNSLFIGSNTTSNGSFVVEIGGKSVLETINTVFGVVNSVIIFANSAYDQANIGTTIANAGYAQANSATANANIAFIVANAAYDQANSATANANIAFIVANAAYAQANSATANANIAFTVANAAYAQANSATANANIAFIVANAAFKQANTAFDQANTANLFANIAYTTANAAYRQANIATINADAAFAFANNIIAGNVAFANVLISNTGSIFFGSNTWAQSNRAALFITNDTLTADEDLINKLIPGDFYYDSATDSIFIYTDFGDSYYDFKDITPKA